MWLLEPLVTAALHHGQLPAQHDSGLQEDIRVVSSHS